MRNDLSVAATVDPITLAEAREWLNIQAGVTTDDGAITQAIKEITAYLEGRLNGRKFITQTWTVTLDEEEVDEIIKLKLLPLQSVSSIKTYDDDGDSTTVASTNYLVTTGERPRITLTANGSWPSDMRTYDSMVITCVVGYGDAGSDVLEDLVMLLRGLTLYHYRNKGEGVTETVSGQLIGIPNLFQGLIRKYRVNSG